MSLSEQTALLHVIRSTPFAHKPDTDRGKPTAEDTVLHEFSLSGTKPAQMLSPPSFPKEFYAGRLGDVSAGSRKKSVRDMTHALVLSGGKAVWAADFDDEVSCMDMSIADGWSK